MIDLVRFEETRVFLDHWDHTMMGKMKKYFKAKNIRTCVIGTLDDLINQQKHHQTAID